MFILPLLSVIFLSFGISLLTNNNTHLFSGLLFILSGSFFSLRVYLMESAIEIAKQVVDLQSEATFKVEKEKAIKRKGICIPLSVCLGILFFIGAIVFLSLGK